ncbi:MAG: hypothetical protein EHM38_09960 [Geobacteraceae bacterium]|nr:MAG: hypothetical protein EHM38_09960 [Geobacteraceae bacterium]
MTQKYTVALVNVLVLLLLSLTSTSVLASGHLVVSSDVWYAKQIRTLFPDGLTLHGSAYPLETLPCLPIDITKFNIRVGRKDIGLGPAFAIEGTLELGAITPPFEVRDGAKGKRYMVFLQAFLISPEGSVVWEQSGFPRGGAWVDAEGSSVQFILIDAYRGSTAGHKVVVFAAGDPIWSDYSEPRVLLGMKEVIL